MVTNGTEESDNESQRNKTLKVSIIGRNVAYPFDRNCLSFNTKINFTNLIKPVLVDRYIILQQRHVQTFWWKKTDGVNTQIPIIFV